MSDLIPNPIPLNAGLDLSTAKMLTEPGSLTDCLNYEVVDQLGYRRIDGLARYDGNITASDLPSARVYSAILINYTGTTKSFVNKTFLDADGKPAGFVFSFNGNDLDNLAGITYISFNGASAIGGSVPSESVSWTSYNVTDVVESLITPAQLTALNSYILGLVTDLPATPVGLHWFRQNLFAVVPLMGVKYVASDDNEPVSYVLNGTLTSTNGPTTATILGKVVTKEAAADASEEGYILIDSYDTFWAAAGGALGGDVSVSSGTINQNKATGPSEVDYCLLWKAVRPEIYNETPGPTVPGWVRVPATITVLVELDGTATEFPALRRNGSVTDSTFYFDDGTGTLEAVLLDWSIVNDGTFADGDAILALQFEAPELSSGTHDLDITTTDIMYSDASAMTKLGDVRARAEINFLPGIPGLKENSSRYEFITANFYADETLDAFYGVNGAGRAFVAGGMSSEGVSFIYTQPDADKDKPRHVENHLLHLALGFKAGSVQLSVPGEPTNFSGDLGAVDMGVGDRVTGLMSLAGETLGVFCEKSVWSIAGATSDDFTTKVILPKVGCIEYTLVDCGEPVFLNNSGVATLSTTDRYGDFLGTKISKNVSSWLLPRLRRGPVGTMNSSGVACAIPVREKNQYRVFFNDGKIMTVTLRDGQEPAITFQEYYFNQSFLGERTNRLVPIAWTSEVDWQGKERIFISHYNEDSPFNTNRVFALETGDSFDGQYIEHYFDTNWYFGDSPIMYHTLQRVRAYGLSRGLASLKIQATGPQTDFYFKGNEFPSTSVPLNLPRVNPIGITTDLQPVTNTADISARGLALQLRVSGSATSLSTIEPTHAVQILMLYTQPDGAFDL